MPLTITVYAISHFAPRLIVRFGPRALMLSGSAIVAVSLVGFALLDNGSSYFPAVLGPLLIHAVGIALIFAPSTVAIMEGVSEEYVGTASGLLQMDQQIGGALGIAVMTAIYAFAGIPGAFTVGLAEAFTGGAILAVLAAIIAWRAVGSSVEGVATPSGPTPVVLS